MGTNDEKDWSADTRALAACLEALLLLVREQAGPAANDQQSRGSGFCNPASRDIAKAFQPE
jgi:hypothetical protein